MSSAIRVLPSEAAPVVCLVSGGSDSVAMLLLALEEPLNIHDGQGESRISRERIHVLHINHNLRGEASDGDEKYVRDLCVKHCVPCKVVSRDVNRIHRENPECSLEEIARSVRYEEAYQYVDELCNTHGYQKEQCRILTAHTADDRIETMLMRLITGSSATGLSSIRVQRDIIVRPLLHATKKQLIDWLTARNVTWREDAMNQDSTFLRCFVRNEIIPLFVKRNPSFISTANRSLDILAHEDRFLESLASDAEAHVASYGAFEVVFDPRALAELDSVISQRVVRLAFEKLATPGSRFTHASILKIVEMAKRLAHDRDTTPISLPGGLFARSEQDGLVIMHEQGLDTQMTPHEGWLSVPGVFNTGTQIITAERLELRNDQDPVAYAKAAAQIYGDLVLDERVLVPIDGNDVPSAKKGLWVSRVSAGDRIAPLGMDGQTKKISDVLNEDEIPLRRRARIAVLKQGPEGSVVCVAGIRIAHAARCSPETKGLVILRNSL